MTDDSILPKALTLDEAYRAAFFMTDLYVGLESDPDEGLVLFRQYLQSDPARWEDWKHAIRKAVRPRAKPRSADREPPARLKTRSWPLPGHRPRGRPPLRCED